MVTKEREASPGEILRDSLNYLHALAERHLTIQVNAEAYTSVDLGSSSYPDKDTYTVDIKDKGESLLTFEIPNRYHPNKSNPVVEIRLHHQRVALRTLERVFEIKLPTTVHPDEPIQRLGVAGNPAQDIIVKLAEKIRGSIPSYSLGK